MRLPRTRRARQSGSTLVELLVAVVIIGFALALVVGTFSSGLLQSTLAKRDTATTAVIQFEMDSVTGAPFNTSPQNYSDCFATETPASPPWTTNYQGSCPANTYTLRADMVVVPGPGASQQWTISVITWPTLAPTGKPVSFLKVNR